MNKLYCISCIIILFTSCRGYLDEWRRTDKQHRFFESRNHIHYSLLKQDTNAFSRLWHFSTDSNFHYHTDSGLIGNTGWLTVYESGHQSSTSLAFLDSVVEQTQLSENTASTWNKKRVYRLPHIFWFWSIITLLTGVCYLLFRYYKRQSR